MSFHLGEFELLWTSTSIPITTLAKQNMTHELLPHSWYLSFQYTKTFLPYSIVIYRCLLVNTAFAPGMSTIVCVSSMIMAGPSSVSPLSNDGSKNTGVSSTRPTLSKYTLCVVSAFARFTDRVLSFSISAYTDSPSLSKVLPIPRTYIIVN